MNPTDDDKEKASEANLDIDHAFSVSGVRSRHMFVR